MSLKPLTGEMDSIDLLTGSLYVADEAPGAPAIKSHLHVGVCGLGPTSNLEDLTPFSNPARLNLQVTEAHVSIGFGISETHFHCHHNMVTCSM